MDVDEKVVSIAERICIWSKPAYAAEELIEGLAEDFLSVFETRAAFGLHKSFIQREIYRNGLPKEVIKF